MKRIADKVLQEIELSNPSTAKQEGMKPRPKMDLMGHDGNIFAILGRAARVLREAGMNTESMEMRRRVQKCGNYYKALGIISEYVETELSVPRDGGPTAKRLKEGDAR